MKKRITAITFLLAGMLLLGACGASSREKITAEENESTSAAENQAQQMDAQSTADIPQADRSVYMVISHDSGNYQMNLMNLSDCSQICYEYTEGTEFFDKYGNYTPREDFSEGKLAVIERLNSNDTLGAIAFTDAVWDYENVCRYSIDAARNRISIADTSYHYDDVSLRVFSDGAETNLQAVGDSDILNVYGIDRKIYAIVVQTGHGMLELTNTKLFEGGWLNLGTKMYAKITPDMSMELPEGVYEFSVANDGYGDTGEIRIRRDKTTTINLNDYKGEGPKLCKLTFDVGVDGAVLTINGKKVNYKKPMKLRYGVYKLGVFADGYDAWDKQLVINSPKANVAILLSEDADTSAGSSGSAAGSSSNNSSSSGSSSSNNNSSSGSSSSKSNNSSGSKNNSSSNSNTAQAGSGTARAGSRAGSLAGSHSGSSRSSAGTGSSSNSNSAAGALAKAALNSSLASVITGGNSTDYLDTLSDLVDSLDRLNRSSSRSKESSESNESDQDQR